MASSVCWGCFSKLRPTPRLLQSLPSPRIASFHTTAPAFALPPKKKKNSESSGPGFRESRSARINKKAKRDKPRPPPVGERRALKERIVLSNTNALEVPNMQDFSVENMGDAALRGQVAGLPMSLVDQLRGAHAFKTTQGWSLFRRPGTLVRKDTVELGALIKTIAEGEKKGKTIKKILTGEKGSGKSVHLTQAMTMALLKGWVVITIPEAQDLTIGHTAYAPVADSDPVQYVQKDAVAKLLDRIVSANGPVLSQLYVSQQHPTLKLPVSPDMSLRQLAMAGVDEPAQAWSIFQALWSELTATKATVESDKRPFAARPPMLVTVDDVAHIMRESKYRNPDFEFIHAHDLVLVKHFVNLLSSQPLPNGGLLLYSTSTSNKPSAYSFDVLVNQIAARTAGTSTTSQDFPAPDPYKKVDQRVLSLLNDAKDVETYELGRLTKDESRGLMEYFALSGILREKVSDEFVSEKWTLAGGGVIGELEKIGKRVRVPPPPPTPEMKI